MREVLINRQARDGSWDPRGDAHSGAGPSSMRIGRMRWFMVN